jgi:multidrug efflux pump
VLGGMIVGTFLGIVFIPLFFVVVQRLFGGRRPVTAKPAAVAGAESSGQD